MLQSDEGYSVFEADDLFGQSLKEVDVVQVFDASNGVLGMQAANEPVLMPVYTYPVPAMPHTLVPMGTFPRYHVPAMQAYSAAMGMPNGRIYQQHLHPASTGAQHLEHGLWLLHMIRPCDYSRRPYI